MEISVLKLMAYTIPAITVLSMLGTFFVCLKDTVVHYVKTSKYKNDFIENTQLKNTRTWLVALGSLIITLFGDYWDVGVFALCLWYFITNVTTLAYLIFMWDYDYLKESGQI